MLFTEFYTPRENLLRENLLCEEPVLFVVEEKPKRKIPKRPPMKDFHRVVNLGQFKPEELKMSLEKNILVLSGTHKEESEGSSFESTFTKKIVVPKGIDLSTINAKIDDKGHLEITGKVEKREEPGIQIPVHFVKDTEVNNNEKEKNTSENETEDSRMETNDEEKEN